MHEQSASRRLAVVCIPPRRRARDISSQKHATLDPTFPVSFSRPGMFPCLKRVMRHSDGKEKPFRALPVYFYHQAHKLLESNEIHRPSMADLLPFALGATRRRRVWVRLSRRNGRPHPTAMRLQPDPRPSLWRQRPISLVHQRAHLSTLFTSVVTTIPTRRTSAPPRTIRADRARSCSIAQRGTDPGTVVDWVHWPTAGWTAAYLAVIVFILSALIV